MPFGGGLLAGAGIVSNIIGGIAGNAAGAGDRGKAHDAMILAMDELTRIGHPPDEAKAIVYQQFKQAGLLTPELEQSIEQKSSEMGGVTGNKQATDVQMQALKSLQQRGQAGLTPEDRAALNQVRNQIASDTEGKRQQILQNFAARGQGGSGAELIAALQGSQSGANAESQAGDRLAAMASQNALQAIGQAGTLGGQIEQQQFGEKSEKAKAQDIINAFNTQNQVGRQARNVGTQNQAQQYNLGTAQNLSNANVQQANQEALRQRQAERQQWLDEMERSKTISGGYSNEARGLQASGDAAAASAAAPYTAIGAGLSTIGTSMMKPKSPSKTMYAGGGDGTEMFAYNGGEIKPGYAEGGEVAPHIDKLRKIFPSMSDDNLQEIHLRANPQMYSQGAGVRDNVTDYRNGGHIPGQAPVSGDSIKNDIVDAKLSPGEYVMKRTDAKSPFGKKLIKLLEAHHEVMKHDKGQD